LRLPGVTVMVGEGGRTGTLHCMAGYFSRFSGAAGLLYCGEPVNPSRRVAITRALRHLGFPRRLRMMPIGNFVSAMVPPRGQTAPVRLTGKAGRATKSVSSRLARSIYLSLLVETSTHASLNCQATRVDLIPATYSGIGRSMPVKLGALRGEPAGRRGRSAFPDRTSSGGSAGGPDRPCLPRETAFRPGLLR